MYRNQMCSPQWLSHQLAAHLAGPSNMRRNGGNGGSNAAASAASGITYNPLDYLPFCLEGINSSSSQLTTVSSYPNLISLALPFDSNPCSPLADLKCWIRATSPRSYKQSKSNSSGRSSSKSDSRVTTPDPDCHRRSNSTTASVGGGGGGNGSISRSSSRNGDHNQFRDDEAAVDKRRKLIRNEATSTNKSLDKTPSKKDASFLKESSQLTVPKIHLANPILQLNDITGDDNLLHVPRSRKRKHPSGGSNSGGSNASSKQQSLAPLCFRPRSASLNSLPRDSLGIDKLSMAMWQHYRERQQTQEMFDRKITLRGIIYNVLKSECSIDLYVVGSSLNGLGTNTSDVDMCLVLRENASDINQSHAVPILKYVKTVLSVQPFVKNSRLILAKVPILKFTDALSGIEVDLNVNNVVGIRNTQLIKCYTRMDKRVPPLVVTVKSWARLNGINDAHNKTMSSYTYTLLVIHYLQYGCEPPVLPCLHNLMPDKFLPDSDITSLSLYEELPKYKSSNKDSIGELFLGFLRYYSHKFPYHDSAISIRTGGLISKSVARECKTGKNSPGQWKYICVEEPFDRTNTAKSVYDEEAFNHVLDVFRRSYHRLSSTQCLASVF